MLLPGDNGHQGPLDRFALFVAGLSPVTLTLTALGTLGVGIGAGLALGVFWARPADPPPAAQRPQAPAVVAQAPAPVAVPSERTVAQYTPPPLPGPAPSSAGLAPVVAFAPPAPGSSGPGINDSGAPAALDPSAPALMPSVLTALPPLPLEDKQVAAPDLPSPELSPTPGAAVEISRPVPPPPPPPPARWATRGVSPPISGASALAAPSAEAAPAASVEGLAMAAPAGAFLAEDGEGGHVLEERLEGEVRDSLPGVAVPLTSTLAAFPPVVAPGPEGTPWRRNAVPVAAWHPPAIAVVIDDLGVDRTRTRAVAALPGPITMAFLPYAEILPDQMRDGRKQGHELLIHMPMEPQNSSVNPGPDALKVGLSDDEILARVRRNLDRGAGYVGINNHMGSRFTTDARGMSVVMAELKRRGLVWLDSVTSPQTVGLSLARAAGVPHAGRAVFLDNVPERAAVDRQLANLEAAARRNGVAIGIGHPKDATIQGLRAWLPSLARKGITLVPVSALMRVETTTVARRP